MHTTHSWFYYFDEQPEVKREEIEHLQPPRKGASTIGKPSYSMEEGIILRIIIIIITIPLFIVGSYVRNYNSFVKIKTTTTLI